MEITPTPAAVSLGYYLNFLQANQTAPGPITITPEEVARVLQYDLREPVSIADMLKECERAGVIAPGDVIVR